MSAQHGWALAHVIASCALMSASALAAWAELTHSQRAWTHRWWNAQALWAAEAVLHDAQRAWSHVPAPPSVGCERGRCVWQGVNGLARAHWQGLLNQAAWGGCSAPPAWAAGWPTLPEAQLACWIESTSNPDGTLVRITAWVQGPSTVINSNTPQAAVMQGVWQAASAGGGRWVSWREVLP